MEDNEHESGLIKDNVLFFSKDNIDNITASPTLSPHSLTKLVGTPILLSGKEYIYQQYQQWGTNNKNNSLASANVGRGGVPEKSADFWGALQMLFKLSLI